MARTQAPTDPILGRLPAAFTRDTARQAGLTHTLLDRLLREGALDRFGHGLLRQTEQTADADLDLLEAALRAPAATICLNSALAHAGLTDEILARWELAIPRGTHRPSGPPTAAWHQFAPATFDLGRDMLPLAPGLAIGLYNAARSIVDAFNPRTSTDRDLAITALRRWLATPAAQPSQLLALAAHWPNAHAALLPVLQVLL